MEIVAIDERARDLLRVERERRHTLEGWEPRNREEAIQKAEKIELSEAKASYYYNVFRMFNRSFFLTDFERVFDAKITSENYSRSEVPHPDEKHTVTVDIFGGTGYFKIAFFPWRLAASISFYDWNGKRQATVWMTEIMEIKKAIYPGSKYSSITFHLEDGDAITIRPCGIHEWKLMDGRVVGRKMNVPTENATSHSSYENSRFGPGFLCSCKNDLFTA